MTLFHELVSLFHELVIMFHNLFMKGTRKKCTRKDFDRFVKLFKWANNIEVAT